MEKKNYCIIGGGITGLYLALKLAKKGQHVTVYERSNRVGGRWKTDPQCKYEMGAWRVSVQRHPKTMNLLKDCLGVKMEPIIYRHEEYVTDSDTEKTLTKGIHACKERSGLSVRDNRVYHTSIKHALAIDSESGYPGQDKGSCTVAEVYGAHSEHGIFRESEQYAYPDIGFQQCIFSLLLKCMETRCVELRLQHTVRRIDSQNFVHGIRRQQQNDERYEDFRSKTSFDWIIWCVPPRCLPTIDPKNNFDLLQASVMHAPLIHIYAPLPVHVAIDTFKIRSNTPVCQTINHRPKSGWWQPCYASGQHALYWYRLYQSDTKAFTCNLTKYLKWILSKSNAVNNTQKTALLNQLTSTRVYFWEHAIHMWEPILFASDKERLHRSIQPNPVKHPNILVAGEALSLHQGWTEGCLQTADMALDIMFPKENVGINAQHTRVQQTFLLYRGLKVNIPNKWLQKHPGGEKAITKYFKKEVTDLWDATHKTNRKSMQHLYALICATIQV